MMKKATKFSLAAGGLLLAAGLILFFCGMAMEDWDFSSLSTVNYEQREYAAQGEVTELSVDICAADIRAEVSEEAENVHISYPVRVDKEGNVLAQTDISEENGVLTLTEESAGPGIEFGFAGSPEMTITLPAKALTKISLRTNAGNISLSGVQAEQVSCASNTGNIAVAETEAEQLILSSDTGNVRAAGSAVGADAVLSANTGNVRAENMTAGLLSLAADTGDVTFAGEVRAERIQARSQLGNISAEAPLSAGEMSFETETGEVELLIRGAQAEYTVIAETDTGNSNIQSAIGGDKTLTIRTDMGNIRVSFVQ